MKNLALILTNMILVNISLEAQSADMNEIDFLAGDVHEIIKADETELVTKYKVFSLSILVPGIGSDLAQRDVHFMQGLNQVMELSKYEYLGQSDSERQKIAQEAFNNYSTTHGNPVDKKVTYLPAEYSGGSETKQVAYEFTKEHGYTPSLTFQWSNSVVTGTLLYKLETIEQHTKY
jgi:hypothetical protein